MNSGQILTRTPVKRKKVAKFANAADVARYAGVSTSTVYKSMRDDPRMNPETREKVRAAADQLKYRPLAGAKALGKGRTDAIGVVFAARVMQRSSQWFGHYSTALEMFSEVLDDHDYAMSVVSWSDEKEELRLPRLFREIGVDGMIVLNTPETPALERNLRRYGKPYVAMDASPAAERLVVAIDEQRAAELVVEHLVQLGHRRIAYVPLPNMPPSLAQFVPWRQEMFPKGYVRAMAEAGLAPMPGWDQPQEFIRYLEKLWANPNPPTAIITYDDSLALSALRWLAARGLQVPADVSVATLQYTGIADQCSNFGGSFPDITCKADCQKEMAKVSVGKLLELIEDPERTLESVLLRPDLVIRASTGTCRSG